LDRLGEVEFVGDTLASNHDYASAFAEYAYREHKDLKEKRDSDGTREFTVSAMYMAILAQRVGNNHKAFSYIREAWNTSYQLHEKFKKWHQYDVNLFSRVVGIEATNGQTDLMRLREIGRDALILAKISETDAILNPNISLDSSQVRHAQRQAVIRARAAKVIVKLHELPPRKLNKKFSNKILQKIVL
jgi:hypothetical protein